MSDKKALVVSRKELQKIIHNFPDAKPGDEAVFLLGALPEAFFTDLEPKLMSRTICETDPNYLQVIPYVTISSNGGSRMFVYSRGSKGHEPALHGSLSLGLGGHIDELPTENQSLANLIAEEAARELNEEVGLAVTKEFIGVIESAVREKSLLIFSNKNDVSNVHLGIAINIGVEEEDIKSLEEGVIVNHRWANGEEMLTLMKTPGTEFEVWSVMILEYLASIQINNVKERN